MEEKEKIKKKNIKYLIESIIFTILFGVLLIFRVELYICLIFLIICIAFVIVFAVRVYRDKKDGD